MPNSRGGTQPPVCDSLRHPSFPHCEFSWREVAGARGSVSEGVGMEILGVRVVRILFFSVTDACLSVHLPQSPTGI